MNQKGQNTVEFIIILPAFFLMVFAILYIGIMFMDYIQYSNAARSIARDISLATIEDRKVIIKELNSNNKQRINQYAVPLTNLYSATFEVEPKVPSITDVDVTVKINLMRNDEDFPTMLSEYNFPPKNIKPITYKMKLEKH